MPILHLAWVIGGGMVVVGKEKNPLHVSGKKIFAFLNQNKHIRYCEFGQTFSKTFSGFVIR